ncbi:hypothetical protein [Streptomyces sp. NPDC029526]|uniref:hypothetical protein n=1 Tax=Streptomyces sp. NPDC029526 TaxID=3155728 RepID=UPI0033C9B5B4
MSESTTATDLTSQYTAQVASDLERNMKEQERISADIAALRQQLTALQRDHAVLLSVQQALGAAPAPVAPAAPEQERERDPEQQREQEDAAATVPAPRRKRATARQTAEQPKRGGKSTSTTRRAPGRKGSGKQATGTAAEKAGAVAGKAGTAAGKTGAVAGKTGAAAGKTGAAAGKTGAAAGKAGIRPTKGTKAAADGPKLVELVQEHLAGQQEPRSAAEIAEALAAARPGRTVKTTVVRSTLEGLVARNRAQRSKQGSSVFYSAPEAGAPGDPLGGDGAS